MKHQLFRDSSLYAFANFQGPAGGNVSSNADAGTQINTPTGTLGFGPREYADTRRQAAFQMAADEPGDINMNAVVERSQVETFDVIGKNFASNDDARQKMSDSANNFRQMIQDRFLGKAVPA